MPQMSPMREMLCSNLVLTLLHTVNVQESDTQHFNLREFFRKLSRQLGLLQDCFQCAITVSHWLLTSWDLEPGPGLSFLPPKTKEKHQHTFSPTSRTLWGSEKEYWLQILLWDWVLKVTTRMKQDTRLSLKTFHSLIKASRPVVFIQYYLSTREATLWNRSRWTRKQP